MIELRVGQEHCFDRDVTYPRRLSDSGKTSELFANVRRAVEEKPATAVEADGYR
jgi:hypothetical protein